MISPSNQEYIRKERAQNRSRDTRSGSSGGAGVWDNGTRGIGADHEISGTANRIICCDLIFDRLGGKSLLREYERGDPGRDRDGGNT